MVLSSVADGNGLEAMLDAAASASNVVIFTGSGLSATSGVRPLCPPLLKEEVEQVLLPAFH